MNGASLSGGSTLKEIEQVARSLSHDEFFMWRWEAEKSRNVTTSLLLQAYDVKVSLDQSCNLASRGVWFAELAVCLR